MNEEPTQPTNQSPYTPRQPVKKWPAHNGFTYDTPIEAIEADLQCKAQEVNGRLQEIVVSRRKFNDAPFDATVTRNLRLTKTKAWGVITQLKRLCDEYQLQAEEDAKAGK